MVQGLIFFYSCPKSSLVKTSLVVLSFLILPCVVWAGPSDKLQKQLQGEIGELRRILDANSKILAETVQAVTQLRTDLQAFSGEIETAKHFIEERGQGNEKSLQEFDFRITGIEEKFVVHSQQLEEILSKGPAAAKSVTTGEELADYQQALSEINTQNFKKAIELFDQFMKKYPKSSLADNAQYWKGEAHFAMKDYVQAILEFEKVNKNHPRSTKAPAARLKQGYAFYEMKSYQDAKVFLQKLLGQYPNSEEATLARERLQKVDQILASNPQAGPGNKRP